MTLQKGHYVVLATALAIAACGGTSGGGTSGTAPYQVVLAGDLSGSQAGNTGVATWAEKAYFDQLNTRGGIDGHRVNLTMLDTQSTPQGATAAFQKSLDSNPAVILMSGSSGEYVTAAPIAVRAKIPVISTGGTPDSAIYPAHAYQYEAIPTAYQSALAQIQVAHILAKENNISNPRVAITGPSVPYVADFSRAVHDLASKYGYTVVSDALNSLTATDFTADAAKIDSARPNIIVGSQTEQFTPVVMSALAADGVKVPLVNFFGSDSPALYDKLQTPDYYAMRFAAFPTDPSLSDMQVAAQRDNVAQYEVRQFFTAGWIAAATTATALRKCGWPCSGTKMNASLEKISKLNLSPYVYGSITLNAKRHYFVSSMQPFHWVSGNIVAYGRPVDVSGQPPEAYVNQVNGASA